MEIEYNNLSALNWMWLVAALAITASMAVAWRRRALRTMIDANLLSKIAPEFSIWRPALRFAVFLFAMIAVVAALIDPRWGT